MAVCYYKLKAEVMNNIRMSMQNHMINEIKNELILKKQDLEIRLEKIENNKMKVSGPLDPNSTEQAVELQSKDVIDALDNIEHKELAQIEQALLRIENKNYGTCALCSEDISTSRLKALPHAQNCINCTNEID
jgi:RNA polymerase-binding protein DksA